MALYERLTGISESEVEKLPIHQFSSMMAEKVRGNVTLQNMVDAFRLDVGEQAELAALEARLVNSKNTYPITFGSYLVLTNVGASYDAIPIAKGLGVVDMDLTGVTSLVFTVRCNKVGTGTISWQLWNDTDGAELGRIDDAAAAGDNKTLQTTINIAVSGYKRLRVRCKSTNASDDPVFYCSSLRPLCSKITWVELEDVLVCAERRLAPYSTVAAVKSRLGV